jgi:hypothetical protein
LQDFELKLFWKSRGTDLSILVEHDRFEELNIAELMDSSMKGNKTELQGIFHQ